VISEGQFFFDNELNKGDSFQSATRKKGSDSRGVVWGNLYRRPTQFQVFNVFAVRKDLKRNTIARIGIGRVFRESFEAGNPEES